MNKEQKKEYNKKYKQERKEQIKESNGEYWQNHKKQLGKRHRKYWKNHRERLIEYGKKYYREHKSDDIKRRNQHRNREREKRYRQEHKELRNQYQRKYKAIKEKANFWESWMNEIWQQKLIKTKGYCPSCHRFIGIDKLTMDHIIPLTKSGLHRIDNVQPLCLSCNSSKNTKIKLNPKKKLSKKIHYQLFEF